MGLLDVILALSLLVCIAAITFMIAALARRPVPSQRPVERREQQNSPTLDELPLSRLDATDKVFIGTQNSTYVFTLNDSDGKSGTLSGGQLGNTTCDAVLVGALNDEGQGKSAYRFLKTNSRALFFIQARNGFERLITSAITKLVLVKGQHLHV